MLGKLRRRQSPQEMPLRIPETADENPVMMNLADLDRLLQDIASRKIEHDNFYYFPVSQEEVDILKAGCSINCGSNEDVQIDFHRLQNLYTHCIVSSDSKKHAPNGSHPA